MGLARHAAARCGILVTLTVIGTAPGPAAATDADPLFLPMASAARITAPPEQPAARAVARTRALVSGPLPTRAQILPSRVQMPDHYSQEIDVHLPMHVAPVEADREVSFDLLPKHYRPYVATIAYDTEDRGPFPSEGDVIRFVFERKF